MTTTDPPDVSADRLRAENDALRRSVAELSVLNEISREIGALTDLDEVLERIVERSVAAVRAEEGVITLVPDERPDVAHTLVRSMATSSDREPYHLTDQLIGWMQLHRRPLRVQRSDGGAFTSFLTSDRIEALLSVPLMVRGRLTGVLTVFNARRDGGFGEADQRLLAIIAGQSAQIIENARLFEEEQQLHRMQDDLRVAYEIQTRFLPAAPPRIDGYELAGRTLPAQEVGGDFFDFIPIDSRRTAICVGDVAGKGLPAALMMASAQATLRGQADPGREPAEVLQRVNWQMYRGTRRGSFLTLFYAELDHERHVLRYVNAGHNRPLLVRDGTVRELSGGGLAIGLAPRAEYDPGEIDLAPGDLVLIYSDGVTEAMDANRGQFSEKRLAEVLAANARASSSEVIDVVLEAVDAFRGGVPAEDDVTLATILRR